MISLEVIYLGKLKLSAKFNPIMPEIATAKMCIPIKAAINFFDQNVCSKWVVMA